MFYFYFFEVAIIYNTIPVLSNICDTKYNNMKPEQRQELKH
jgi:hypothetical protein